MSKASASQKPEKVCCVQPHLWCCNLLAGMPKERELVGQYQWLLSPSSGNTQDATGAFI